MTRGLRTGIALITGILTVLVTVVAGLAFWADQMVNDTDRYVDTVAPLAQDAEVRQAVAYLVSQEVLAELDLPGLSAQGASELSQRWDLPSDVTDLIDGNADELASAAEEQVVAVIGDVVESPAFPGLWREANRVAHQEVLTRAADPDDDSLTAANGEVLLDLQPLVAAARAELVSRGLPGADLIQDVDRTVVIAQSDGLANVLERLVWVERAATWLPWVALGLAALTFLVANRRSAAAAGIGLGVAGAALLTYAALGWGASRLGEGSGVADAATTLVDEILSEPRMILLILAGAGAALAVVGVIGRLIMPPPRQRW